jgi:hypothetical protein
LCCDKGKQQVTPFNKSSGAAVPRDFLNDEESFIHPFDFSIQNAIINNVLVNYPYFSKIIKRVQKLNIFIVILTRLRTVPQVEHVKIWSSN